MLRTSTFPPLCNSMTLLNTAQTNVAFSLAFATKTHLCSLSAPTLIDVSFPLCFKSLQFRQPCVNLNAVYGNGLSVGAVKKRGQGGGVGVVETDDFDEDGGDSDYDVEDVGDEEDEDDDDDEGVVLPFEQMRKWLKNKPRGFGEGKVYDTSVEDKLLDEMRQSRETQAANLNKLKNDSLMPGANKNDQKNAQEVQSGVRVRLVNLPKKKNIHRDLKQAFQGIPGIVDIIPVVSGNKKTRDPVCKGFAFVYFKCEDDAARFVQLFSGQTISFGKIQKQIKCELLNEQSSAFACLGSSKNLSVAAAPQIRVPAIEESPIEDSNMDDSAFSSWNEATSSTDDFYHLGKQMYRAEPVLENQEFAATLNVDDEDDSVELQIDSEINPLSLKQKSPAKLKQGSVAKKKPPTKEKVKKDPKLEVPGSAKRLKVREKAVLSDVFSKYGSKTAFASKDS